MLVPPNTPGHVARQRGRARCLALLTSSTSTVVRAPGIRAKSVLFGSSVGLPMMRKITPQSMYIRWPDRRPCASLSGATAERDRSNPALWVTAHCLSVNMAAIGNSSTADALAG